MAGVQLEKYFAALWFACLLLGAAAWEDGRNALGHPLLLQQQRRRRRRRRGGGRGGGSGGGNTVDRPHLGKVVGLTSNNLRLIHLSQAVVHWTELAHSGPTYESLSEKYFCLFSYSRLWNKCSTMFLNLWFNEPSQPKPNLLNFAKKIFLLTVVIVQA